MKVHLLTLANLLEFLIARLIINRNRFDNWQYRITPDTQIAFDSLLNQCIEKINSLIAKKVTGSTSPRHMRNRSNMQKEGKHFPEINQSPSVPKAGKGMKIKYRNGSIAQQISPRLSPNSILVVFNF